MSEHTESVKKVAAYLRDIASKRPDTPVHTELTGYAKSLDAAGDRIIELEGLTSALPPDLGNIHDLPAELLSELSVSKTDELEDQIVTVINAYGGEASLDQILVGLYRKFKTVQKRRFMQNKLYRMSMVWSVDGKKGVYTTTEPDEAEPLDDNGRTYGGHSSSESDYDSEIPF